MKVKIIFYYPAQTGKNLVPDTRHNVISQSNWRFLKLTVSLEQNDEIAWFLDFKFIKIKSWLKNFWMGIVKWVWVTWTGDSNIGYI